MLDVNQHVGPAPQNLATVLPSSPFGLTSQRFTSADNPFISIPERQQMLAANRLNEYLHRKLSEKQRMFIEVYLSSRFNASEAAKQAGYCNDIAQDDKYEKRCASRGKQICNSKHIATGIELAMQYHSLRNRLDVDEMLMELRRIAFSNMGDFFVNDGAGDPQLVMPGDHERDKLACISEITIDTYMEGKGPAAREVKRVKFKMHNKLDAIEKLLKIAIAQGHSSVVDPNKVQQELVNTGQVTNVFNFLPVPSGGFLPAPAQQLTPMMPNQSNMIAAPAGLRDDGIPPVATDAAQNVPHMHHAPPLVHNPGESPQWGQPERAQHRQLTIDHIA